MIYLLFSFIFVFFHFLTQLFAWPKRTVLFPCFFLFVLFFLVSLFFYSSSFFLFFLLPSLRSFFFVKYIYFLRNFFIFFFYLNFRIRYLWVFFSLLNFTYIFLHHLRLLLPLLHTSQSHNCLTWYTLRRSCRFLIQVWLSRRFPRSRSPFLSVVDGLPTKAIGRSLVLLLNLKLCGGGRWIYTFFQMYLHVTRLEFEFGSDFSFHALHHPHILFYI